MTEQVDVLIAGTGFGGSIAAWRLAESYVAAGADPKSILMLDRGKRFGHTDFKQSMGVEYLSSIYDLDEGQGMEVVTANAVGGGSNLYLAASLRAPTETFERRDHRPGDGDDRRMWPASISRATLNPFYTRVEQGLRVNHPTWSQVSKSGGLWAAALHAAGHTCDRVPVAINPDRCVNAKWCHTGCIFGAKNSLITNYLAAAEHLGVQVRPLTQVESVRTSSNTPYRYLVSVAPVDTSTGMNGASVDIECKVCILATGAANDAPILMRSQDQLPSLSSEVGKHLGSNGDHVAAIEFDPQKVKSVLGLPGYADFYKGKPITTMSYDWWVGRRGHEYDGTRFNLQEIFLSSLTNLLYDDGRGTGDPTTRPSWWGVLKKDAIAHWANRIELLAMVEDTSDGTFLSPGFSGGGSQRTGAGPISFGVFEYAQSEQSMAVRAAANDAIAQVAKRKGVGRFMKLTETQGVYCAHPLGGCRMADDPSLGVVDNTGAVYGYEGLYCFGSSIIPTSLGVNPSLTISAVAERNASLLVARAADLGLPAAPHPVTPATPPETVGPRVIPPKPKPARTGTMHHRRHSHSGKRA